MPDDRYDACLKFIDWMEGRLLRIGRGDDIASSDNAPSGRFWLGRLAPEDQMPATANSERIGRLEPCAIGIRCLPGCEGPWTFEARVRAKVWLNDGSGWTKSAGIDVRIPLQVTPGSQSFAKDAIKGAFETQLGIKCFAAELRTEFTKTNGQAELLVQLVNASPAEHATVRDTRLYEVELTIEHLPTKPYLLEALPDSFRYDRRIGAYGVNCGVREIPGGFVSTDTISVDRPRPIFWGGENEPPDLSFKTLEEDPLPALERLVDELQRWGERVWTSHSLDERAARHGWSDEMRREAAEEAKKFGSELERVAQGVEYLRRFPDILRAFSLMNRAIARSARGRGYDRWRPFQVGFILSNLGCILEPEREAEIVDVVWFSTGGGKTETYLGLLVTAALFDRMKGKICGVTAWTRFPLRMLSLQQLQRFADALAAAEMVRREANIGGSSFAIGFFVGQGATPNRLSDDPKEYEPDIEDEEMPGRYKILQKCPFCRSAQIGMRFDRANWRLDHVCENPSCEWPEEALPFHIVDEEIYRFLPTIVVGTLDKAASIGMQGAMRGLVGAPLGLCSRPGHGFVYAPRSKRPRGCLVPGCNRAPHELPMDARLFGPSYRLQDELHLLRDSLGAVDAHYEALLDGLEEDLCGRRPKILASSATLEGYEAQIDVLYRRQGRVFPQPGPSTDEGFWTKSSNELMRRFVAIAPRGLTIEFVIDRMATEMQDSVRLLVSHPDQTCREIGVDSALAPFLYGLYGTQVIYGNTLRDLDAVERSISSGQIRPADGKALHHAILTGRTDFQDVAKVLERLEKPEEAAEDRLHLITASSMMSHGVDIDRLNIMVMSGLPLGSAEFIQSTARVGRRWPALVFVIHKIGRERDASVFRSFTKFVEQGDRFIEPIPITRKSRRVLERTIAGLELARILTIHEPAARHSLATLPSLRKYLADGRMRMQDERDAIVRYLGIQENGDARLIEDLDRWFQRFEQNIVRFTPDMKFPSDACPDGRPMISLRDVEEQVSLFLDRRP